MDWLVLLGSAVAGAIAGGWICSAKLIRSRRGRESELMDLQRLALRETKSGFFQIKFSIGKVLWDENARNLFELDDFQGDIDLEIKNRFLENPQESWVEELRQASKVSNRHHCQFLFRSGKNNEQRVFVTSARFLELDGKPDSAVGIYRDVTQVWVLQKRIEQETKAAKIRSKREVLGGIAANIAHEINNPLAVVIGNSKHLEMLAQDQEVTLPEVEKIAHSISEAGCRISEVVRRLSSFIVLDQQSTPRETGLNEMVKLASELFSDRLKQAKIQFEVPPLEMGKADPKILCRVGEVIHGILHLFFYATDLLGSATSPKISIKTSQNWPLSLIQFEFIGAEIPKHFQDRVFEPFFHPKGVVGSESSGLTAAQHLFEANGGVLSLKSSGSGRTVFEVSFTH
ncbi:MAG: HAMP domain-containing histidine kinase [Bdellovibrionales bacterium]|nr:HAMP domain-containing histidine kinase [Bdellovibrionales bacterium]